MAKNVEDLGKIGAWKMEGGGEAAVTDHDVFFKQRGLPSSALAEGPAVQGMPLAMVRFDDPNDAPGWAKALASTIAIAGVLGGPLLLGSGVTVLIMGGSKVVGVILTGVGWVWTSWLVKDMLEGTKDE